jgi:hypothetical protein
MGYVQKKAYDLCEIKFFVYILKFISSMLFDKKHKFHINNWNSDVNQMLKLRLSQNYTFADRPLFYVVSDLFIIYIFAT